MSEQLKYGIRREWLDGGAVCVLTVPDTINQETVAYWGACVLESLGQFPPGVPARLLHDLSGLGGRIPSYVRKQADRLYHDLATQKRLFGAFVVPDGLVTDVLTVIHETRPPQTTHIEERLFSTREDALAWLRR
jgi:hypothetical protein